MKFARPVHESGSVLILILVAVALFGALSFTVTKMLRDGKPQIITEEKARVYAQEIVTFGNAVRQAVQDVRISNGCEETDISFETVNLPGYTHGPAARDACKIFGDQGGNVTYVAPEQDWLDRQQSAQDLYKKIYVSGTVCIPGVGGGTTSACATDGEDNEELILFIPYIRDEVCKQLNELAGAGAIALPETGDAWPAGAPPFDGTFEDGASLDQPHSMHGCFKGDAGGHPGDGTYSFFQVLLAR